jgi:isopentenyl-diphosphate delta-isomerase
MQKFSTKTNTLNTDPTSSDRKKDHIELAFESQQQVQHIDSRFYYEPILSGHPTSDSNLEREFASAVYKFPLWVSSMTGGTKYAAIINKNLAKACRQFGLGMGLGSCRSLLYSDEAFDDFNVRKYIGDRPLFANLGIAQVEELVQTRKFQKLKDLVSKLAADGLIIHINPLQEWTQPEGDRYFHPPLETIASVLDKLDVPIIVKEVGQGMGISSLKALMKLPLAAIDFAANGGTNFSKLELLRSDSTRMEALSPIVGVGHSADEMVELTNDILKETEIDIQCSNFIISGGIKTFLDGYYLISKINSPAIYGQASSFLKHARGSYEDLERYVSLQVEGLKMANSFLRIKTKNAL